jgi:hypothetical protein
MSAFAGLYVDFQKCPENERFSCDYKILFKIHLLPLRDRDILAFKR